MDDKEKGLFEPTLVGEDTNNNHQEEIKNEPGEVNVDELKSLDEKIIGMDKIEEEKAIQKELAKVNDYNSKIGEMNDKQNSEPIENKPIDNPINNKEDIINIKSNNNEENQVQLDNNLDDDKINIKMNNTNNTANIQDKSKDGKSNLVRIISAVLVVLIGAGVSWFLTHRKNNWSIVCTKSESGIEQEFTIDIKDGTYYNGTIKQVVDMEEMAKQYGANIDDIDLTDVKMCDTVKSQSTVLYTYKNCREEVDGKKINVYVDLDINMGNKKVGSIEEAKKEFEQGGYSCK